MIPLVKKNSMREIRWRSNKNKTRVRPRQENDTTFNSKP